MEVYKTWQVVLRGVKANIKEVESKKNNVKKDILTKFNINVKHEEVKYYRVQL